MVHWFSATERSPYLKRAVLCPEGEGRLQQYLLRLGTAKRSNKTKKTAVIMYDSFSACSVLYITINIKHVY